LLDEVVGNHFAVIASAEVLADVTEATRQVWAHWQVRPLDASDPVLAAWLASHQAQAVVLRPDRYVLGLAHNSAELDALTHDWLPVLATAESVT
jgi:3-(3-hydroxy-phenyl)propionate hydroxylase